MKLQHDPEHIILRDSAEKFLAERYDFSAFKAIAASEPGWSEAIWQEFAKLGWLGLPIAEDYGGSAADAASIAVLMESLGRHIVLEPYLATVILGGGLIAALASRSECRSLLPPMVDGRQRFAFA